MLKMAKQQCLEQSPFSEDLENEYGNITGVQNLKNLKVYAHSNENKNLARTGYKWDM